jgi:hypothetical protein
MIVDYSGGIQVGQANGRIGYLMATELIRSKTFSERMATSLMLTCRQYKDSLYVSS